MNDMAAAASDALRDVCAKLDWAAKRHADMERVYEQ